MNDDLREMFISAQKMSVGEKDFEKMMWKNFFLLMGNDYFKRNVERISINTFIKFREFSKNGEGVFLVEAENYALSKMGENDFGFGAIKLYKFAELVTAQLLIILK